MTGWPRTLICAACVLLWTASSSASAGLAQSARPSAAPNGPDDEVRDYRLHALDARVQSLPPGVERDYLAGVLAGRRGHTEESIPLLTRALPGLRDSQPQRAAIALEALAEGYVSSYRYREAARAYDDLEQHFAGYQGHDVADDAALARLLVDVPVQTVTWDGPVRVPMSRNPIGSVTSAITANGTSEQWLLDTGANYTVVSRSFAQTLGLTPLAGSATVGSGVTGLTTPLQVAVLPDLHLGGATVHHAVAMILDDASLRIGSDPTAYQIHAILGYPVLKALGRITFTRKGEFLAGEAAEKASGVPMYMRGLSPAIECDVDGHRLLFTFDTGASSTDFSVRYFNLFHEHRGTWQTRTVESGGAGGTVRREMYIQPDVVVKVGDATATLKDVTIFPTPMNAGIDVLFGNIGQDLVAGFESFTVDFVGMTFGLGPPSPR
ncbi:MAG TPA: retroviral-like aspartic protease family protein [Vicinamibacterales bacterium]|nr:retroviral-like aspartic protease family protein [Vicinamibacterales bacterium]